MANGHATVFTNPPVIVGDGPADGDTCVWDAASGTWKAGQNGTSVPDSRLIADAVAQSGLSVDPPTVTCQWVAQTGFPVGSDIELLTDTTIQINTNGIYAWSIMQEFDDDTGADFVGRVFYASFLRQTVGTSLRDFGGGSYGFVIDSPGGGDSSFGLTARMVAGDRFTVKLGITAIYHVAGTGPTAWNLEGTTVDSPDGGYPGLYIIRLA